MKSYFNENASTLLIDKYDKLCISVGDNLGVLNPLNTSLVIKNKNKLEITSGLIDITSKKDINILSTENINITNDSLLTGINIKNISNNGQNEGQISIKSEKTILINNSDSSHILDVTQNNLWNTYNFIDGQVQECINMGVSNFNNSTDIGGIVGKLVHNNPIDTDNYKRFFYSRYKDIKGTDENLTLKDKYIMGFNNYDKNDECLKRNPYTLMTAWDSDSLEYVSKSRYLVDGTVIKNELDSLPFYSLGGFNIGTTNLYDKQRNKNQVLRSAKQNVKLDLNLTGDIVFRDSVKARNNFRFNNSTISTDNSQDLESYINSSIFTFEYNSNALTQTKEISANNVEEAEYKPLYTVDAYVNTSIDPKFRFKVPVVLEKGNITQPIGSSIFDINKSCGTITTLSLSLATEKSIEFTINNNTVSANSVVLVSISNYKGSGIPIIAVQEIKNGSFKIKIVNISINALDKPLTFNFVVH